MIALGSPKSIVGLDIGTSAIKLVHLKRGSAGPQLVGFGMAPLPHEGVIVDGAIVDSDSISGIIKQVMATTQAKGGSIVTALSGQNVIVRFIRMPEIPDAELKETITYEAEQYVPYPIDDVAISFEKLARVESEDVGQFLILLVVAQKELIANYMGTLRMAGVSPSVLDVDIFASLNALHASSQDGVSAVVDIGAGTTNISILKDGVLQFTRNIPIAGNNITTVIQSVLKLDFEQAENIKKEEGIVVAEEEENEVSEVVRTITEELASEIRRSFDYYKAQYREGLINKILLTGGTAKLKNLDVFLANELGVEVELGDPLMGLQIDIPNQEQLFEHIQELTVGLGLALREVVD